MFQRVFTIEGGLTHTDVSFVGLVQLLVYTEMTQPQRQIQNARAYLGQIVKKQNSTE